MLGMNRSRLKACIISSGASLSFTGPISQLYGPCVHRRARAILALYAGVPRACDWKQDASPENPNFFATKASTVLQMRPSAAFTPSGHPNRPSGRGHATLTHPSFYVAIKSMRPAPGARIRRSHSGTWWPPKRAGSNVPIENTSTLWFYYNGTTMNPSPPLHLQPEQPYRVVSLYQSGGVIYTAPCDATLGQVSNGNESSAGQYPMSHDFDDWKTLSFDEAELIPGLFKVGREATYAQLPYRHREQRWVDFLLTDVYAPPPEKCEQEHIRLAGSLATLLGLVTLTIPPNLVGHILPTVIRWPRWMVPLDRVDRRKGWHDGRGLVVTIYTDPGNAVRPPIPSHILGEFEAGRFGPIFE